MRTTQSLGLTGVALRGDVLSRESATRLGGPSRRYGQIRGSFAWARALSRRERCARADHDDPERDNPGRAAAIFAAKSVGLRRRQPKRPRLQRRLQVLQQHLQRADAGSNLRHDRLRPQMLQSVQGMPQHQGLRLAHAQLLLSGAEGTDHEVKSPWPRPRSRRAAARGKPARGIG
jgi:hypothetical protein